MLVLNCRVEDLTRASIRGCAQGFVENREAREQLWTAAQSGRSEEGVRYEVRAEDSFGKYEGTLSATSNAGTTVSAA